MFVHDAKPRWRLTGAPARGTVAGEPAATPPAAPAARSRSGSSTRACAPDLGASHAAAALDPPRPARIIRPVRGALLDSVDRSGLPGTRWHARGRFKSLKLNRQAWHVRGRMS